MSKKVKINKQAPDSIRRILKEKREWSNKVSSGKISVDKSLTTKIA
jgi:hypothetical protein